jgi:hypothetical protein
VLHSKSIRLTIAALAASASIGAVAFVAAGSASAALSIKCSALSGSAAAGGTITLSGCTGNTGGASQPTPTATLQNGGTITWVNNLTTTVSKPTASQTETDTTETKVCPAGTTEFESKGKVVSDTTGSAPAGGVTKAEACVNLTTLSLNNEPGSKAIFK